MQRNVAGTVKWFDNAKGYGFITSSEVDGDVFVHYRNVISDDDYKTLREGQEVDFILTSGNKGYQAAEVRSEETATA